VLKEKSVKPSIILLT